MFKKMLVAAVAALTIVGFSACSHVDTGTTLNGIKLTESDSSVTLAHMNGGVWGIYFCNMLPLFTGSTTHPGTCAIFRDTVQLDNAINMMTRKAKQLDATKLIDVQSSKSSFILPLLFSFKFIDVSGTAVK